MPSGCLSMRWSLSDSSLLDGADDEYPRGREVIIWCDEPPELRNYSRLHKYSPRSAGPLISALRCLLRIILQSLESFRIGCTAVVMRRRHFEPVPRASRTVPAAERRGTSVPAAPRRHLRVESRTANREIRLHACLVQHRCRPLA